MPMSFSNGASKDSLVSLWLQGYDHGMAKEWPYENSHLDNFLQACICFCTFQVTVLFCIIVTILFRNICHNNDKCAIVQ